MPTKFHDITNQSERARMEDLYQAITSTDNWHVIEKVDPKNICRTFEIAEILAAMEHPELFSGFSLMAGIYYMKNLAQK